MAQPRLSKYRKLFDNLPDEFKEDITLIIREKTGEDDYNKPIMSDVSADVLPNGSTIKARVEMLTGANRIPEEGGVRDTRQARVFFKGQRQNLLRDHFNYVGDPDPTIWDIFFGTPTVDGSKLILADDDAVRSKQSFKYARALVRFPSLGYQKSGAIQFSFKVIAEIIEEAAIIPSAWGKLRLYTEDGYSEVDVHLPGNRQLMLDWQRDKVDLWFTTASGLEKMLTRTTGIPDEELPLEIKAYLGGVGDIPVDWALVSNISSLNINDHVLIREKEYAIIEEPLLTHLQQELLVQEVIP